jgi:hypothetical protein
MPVRLPMTPTSPVIQMTMSIALEKTLPATMMKVLLMTI